MNDDLISRSELRKRFQAILDRGDMFCEYDIIGMVDNAQPVDIKPFALVSFDKDELKRIVDEQVIEPIKNGELVLKIEEGTGEWKSPKESLPRTTDKTEKYASVGAINFRESDEVLCYLKPKCKMNSLDTDDRFIVARYCMDENESSGYQTYWYASGDDGTFDIEDVIAWSYINKDGLNIKEAENE